MSPLRERLTAGLGDASIPHAGGQLLDVGLTLPGTRKPAGLEEERIDGHAIADRMLQERHRVGV